MELIRKCSNFEKCDGRIWTGTERPFPELCVQCFYIHHAAEFQKFLATLSIRAPEKKLKFNRKLKK